MKNAPRRPTDRPEPPGGIEWCGTLLGVAYSETVPIRTYPIDTAIIWKGRP